MAVNAQSFAPNWELTQLLDIFPLAIRQALVRLPNVERVIEVVLDLGRPPEARFEDDFVFLSDVPITRRGHRARHLAALAVRRRQPRRDRADAAPHQRDSQPDRPHRRTHLPRRARRVRHDRHRARRDSQRQVDLSARASRRRQDDDAARVRARPRRRPQARRDRRHLERDRRRRRRPASRDRALAPHAGPRSAPAAQRDDRSGREPHAAGDRHRRDRHRSGSLRGAHDRRARRAAHRYGARADARKSA